MNQVYDGDLRWSVYQFGHTKHSLQTHVNGKNLMGARFWEPFYREEMEVSEGTAEHGYYCARYLMLTRRIEALLCE